MIEKLEVDRPVPMSLISLYSKYPEDGANIQVMEDGTLMLLIVISGLKKSEINDIRKEPVYFRMYADGNINIPLVGFGLKLKFELPFNPTVYKSEYFNNLGNQLDIVFVERDGAILKVYRVIGLGEEFMWILKKQWAAAILDLDWKSRFDMTLSKMYQKSVDQNWGESAVVDWRA